MGSDYAGAKQLLDTMVTIPPEVQKTIEKLSGVPVDIAPKFTTAQELTGQSN